MKSNLYLRVAGFGDMLKQMNLFYHLSDQLGFSPEFYIRPENNLNAVTVQDFFAKIGFSSIVAPIPAGGLEAVPSLSQINNQVVPNYIFDEACYGRNNLTGLIGDKAKSMHPTLCGLARQSELFSEIQELRQSTCHITVHVRRGDVAQLVAQEFPDVFDQNVTREGILHCKGLFDRASLKKAIPSSNHGRFASVASHIAALNEAKRDLGIDKYILISDGFTKIANTIIESHREVLQDQSITADTLEARLEGELQELREGADLSIVGTQKSKFYDALRSALSAKAVVSRSPGYIQDLARLFGDDIRFFWAWRD